MLRIPPIATLKPWWKSGMLPLQRHVPAAHDALPQIIKAVAEMPRALFRQLVHVVRSVGSHHLNDGMQAMELMGYGSRES